MSNAFVVALGMGTVFVGLICIIILCKIVGAVCMAADKKNAHPVNAADNVTAVPVEIENRQEIIAAVAAAVAEDLGTDVSAIRILSFKKL